VLDNKNQRLTNGPGRTSSVRTRKVCLRLRRNEGKAKDVAGARDLERCSVQRQYLQ
jgi:hypothetical protein